MTHEQWLALGILFACSAAALSGVLAAWAAHMAAKANIELVGLKNSTHQVQYVPMPEPARQHAGDDEYGMPQHDDPTIDAAVRRGERSTFEAAGDLDDETFTN